MAKYLLIYKSRTGGMLSGERCEDVEADGINISDCGALEFLGTRGETLRALAPGTWAEVKLAGR